MKLLNGFRDFIRGLSILFGKPDGGKGDRKLAKVSLMVEAQITPQTKHYIRRNVIKDIERELRKAAKKGGKEAIDEKIVNALETPEYVRMLHRLGMEESHIRVMALEALKNEK